LPSLAQHSGIAELFAQLAATSSESTLRVLRGLLGVDSLVAGTQAGA
jgi:hypothetical protein